MCSIETETKHQLEGINESNLYYFEILSSHVDPLPSREDIFNNGVFKDRRIIADLVVALICKKIKVLVRTQEKV